VTVLSFDADWEFKRIGEVDGRPITLPHDAMREENRSPGADGGATTGYFPGGRYLYTKTWRPADDIVDRRLSLFFEGVYGDAEVRLNGHVIATSTSYYTEFEAVLDSLDANENLIEVEVDNSHLPNTRWYSGSGIYRRVWLHAVDDVSIAHDGLRLSTTRITDPAEVELTLDLENAGHEVLEIKASISFNRGVSAVTTTTTSDSRATLVLPVSDPLLWSADNPALYDVNVQVTRAGDVVDERTVRYGLRTVAVQPGRGLLINGESVLLRGGCVHHDNGVLGAATFRAAEFRRARILKANGFNAIRSAHNPLSRDFLDACDEVGLYVMDELSDTWFAPKTPHDKSAQFETLWRTDVQSMVAKDRNHPSVIMYSIGNEIAETGTPRGVQTAHDVSAYVKSLDPDRPTTLALNLLLNVLASYNFALDELIAENTKPKQPRKGATSTAANTVANALGRLTDLIPLLPRADKFTRDAFSHVDIAGYNYAFRRYAGDSKRHATRTIVGSESLPGNIVDIWERVLKYPNVIGDFSWTGWDYLGEAGIGTWRYGNEGTGLVKPYPQIIAGAGTIDITGVPGAAALLARAVWAQLDVPAIAVRPLDRADQRVSKLTWRSTDAIESWSWKGCEGQVADIEVYSDDDEVELFINGRSLGKRRAGRASRFVSRFRAPYEPGEITAVGYTAGVETGRSSLRTAREDVGLRLQIDHPDLPIDESDLLFVDITVGDSDGIVEMLDDDDVTIEVTGGGTLAGFGSAAPTTVRSFTDPVQTTYYGRALAVVRPKPTGGPISVTASSTRHGSTALRVDANPAHPLRTEHDHV
jgi:beta-galactosidase